MDHFHEVLTAGVAGILSHNLIFIRGEWHLQATRVLEFYCLLYALIIVLEIRYNGFALLPAVVSASRIFAFYATSLYTSMAVYRSAFHRLRHFPGPFLARFSKLWHLFHCLGSKNHLLLDNLHDQYGDFVRTGN